MQFNPINLFGFIIVAIMLIPNIIYGIKFKDVENKCTNKAMNIIEQVGRYGSMALMVLPLFEWFDVISLDFGSGSSSIWNRAHICDVSE